MHAWRLGFGSVVMAVSAVTWMTRGPAPAGMAGPRGATVATRAVPQRVSATSATCAMPAPASAVDRALPALAPLQPQVLPARTVVLVDSPVALAGGPAAAH